MKSETGAARSVLLSLACAVLSAGLVQPAFARGIGGENEGVTAVRGQRIAPPVPSMADAYASPRIAFAGDRFLTAWVENRGSDLFSTISTASAEGGIALAHSIRHPEVYRAQVAATWLSESGELRSRVLSLGPARQMSPAIASNARGWLMAWTESRERDYFVAIDHYGAELEDEGQLASRDLAWNGEEYLILSRRDSELMATQWRPSFPAPSPGPLFPWREPVVVTSSLGDFHPPDGVAAVWGGDRWIIVWPEGERLMFAPIDRAGTVSPPRALVPETHLPRNFMRIYESVALEWDGNELLLAWSEWHAPPCMMPACDLGSLHTFAQLLTLGGELRGVAPTPVPGNGLSVSTEAGNDAFLVVSGRTASLVGTAGDAAIVIRTVDVGPDVEARSDVTRDGDQFVIASRYRDSVGYWNLLVTRFDMQLVPRDSRWTRTLAPDRSEWSAPGIAVMDDGQTFIVLQEGSSERGAAVAAYVERDLTPLPPSDARRRAVRR